MKPAVSIAETSALRYRSRAAEVTLAELDYFLEESISEFVDPGADGPPFAVFHGRVTEMTQSRVEVGVPAPDGDQALVGGRVVRGGAGDAGLSRARTRATGFPALGSRSLGRCDPAAKRPASGILASRNPR